MVPGNFAKRVLVMTFPRQRVDDTLQVEEVAEQEAMTRGDGLQMVSSV